MDFRKILPILGFLVVAAAAVLFYKNYAGNGAPEGPAPPSAESLLTVTADDIVLGSPDAPVTIFEYASLTCPHCAHFTLDTLPRLKAEYIDTGKVKLVFRDFPLDTWALKASMLAHCAGPERFYGFLDVLFHNQPQWSRAEDPAAALAGIAKMGGMGSEAFERCMNDDALSQRISKTRFDAEKALTIQSTPTFFVNGEELVGSQPYEAFQAAIEKSQPGP